MERCLVVEDVAIVAADIITDAKIDLYPAAEKTLGAILPDYLLPFDVMILAKLLFIDAQLDITKYSSVLISERSRPAVPASLGHIFHRSIALIKIMVAILDSLYSIVLVKLFQ